MMKAPTTFEPSSTVKKAKHAVVNGYRSGFEDVIHEWLKSKGIDGEYEANKIKYVKPAKPATYTPDFRLPNGIFIETKGRFLTADRQKHVLIRDQYPEYDIRFVFTNPKQRISKNSRTTYAMWCEKNGFKYASKTIPEDWLTEG